MSDDEPVRATMTKYEHALLVATRRQQISEGGVPMVDVQPGDTVEDLVQRELDEGKCPLLVSRRLPDGTTRQYRVSDMLPRIHFRAQ